MNNNFRNFTAYLLIGAVPAVAVFCETRCSEACEEVGYSAHPHETTAPIPSGDNAQAGVFTSGTSSGTSSTIILTKGTLSK